MTDWKRLRRLEAIEQSAERGVVEDDSTELVDRLATVRERLSTVDVVDVPEDMRGEGAARVAEAQASLDEAEALVASHEDGSWSPPWRMTKRQRAASRAVAEQALTGARLLLRAEELMADHAKSSPPVVESPAIEVDEPTVDGPVLTADDLADDDAAPADDEPPAMEPVPAPQASRSSAQSLPDPLLDRSLSDEERWKALYRRRLQGLPW